MSFNTGGMPDVRPITDLRQNMTEILESIDIDKKPVILTKHGRGRYIMLGLDEYNRLTGIEALRKEIRKGIEAEKAGDVSDFDIFAAQLKRDLKNGRL